MHPRWCTKFSEVSGNRLHLDKDSIMMANLLFLLSQYYVARPLKIVDSKCEPAKRRFDRGESGYVKVSK